MTARQIRAARTLAALSDRLDHDPHLPERPSWDCQECDQPWPCPPAKVRLSEAYAGDHVGLRMYAGSLLFAATAELPDADPADLHERMLGWTKHRA